MIICFRAFRPIGHFTPFMVCEYHSQVKKKNAMKRPQLKKKRGPSHESEAIHKFDELLQSRLLEPERLEL